MKKSTLLLCAWFMIAAASFAQSQIKLGHTSSEILLLAMPETKRVEAQLDTVQKKLQQEYDGEMQKYRVLLEELDKLQSTGASQTIIKVKEDQALAQQELVQKLPSVYEEEISEKQQILMEPILKKLQEAISSVAKENGLTYVLDSGKGTLLYAETSQDITNLVKAKLGLK